MNPIYLDYNATTPVDQAVAAAIRPYLEHLFGNPSSSHSFGIESRVAVQHAREQIARMVNADPDEIVFTSGGTESNNMAIKGIAFANRHRGNHIITVETEHPAVIQVCKYLERNGFSVTYLPVDQYGRVEMEQLQSALTSQTILVSVMHANNEVGTIQPVEEIGAWCRQSGVIFHSDAAQSIGKIPVDVKAFNVDLLSMAGHKFYAPKGIGSLYIRRGTRLEKLMHGADHESNLRAGTENVPLIVGLGMAASQVDFANTDYALAIETVRNLRDTFYQSLLEKIPDIRLNGHPVQRLPNTLSLGFRGIDATILLNSMKGVAASAGAACHSDEVEISAVLQAMKVPEVYAAGTLRFSLGRYTTPDEIDQAVAIIEGAYKKLKGDSVLHPVSLRSDNDPVKLTEYTHALGCACKIRPQLLERILQKLPAVSSPDVLVGFETSDDAAVYRIDETRAIVQTVDIIPPVVDDPYQFGAIAAANAISDIYAMGGTPSFALSIVGFPDRVLPVETLHAILLGAADKASEAGIPIIGGHTIEDQEPKFGLAVTGFIHPDKIIRNRGVIPGDKIILTKPVGTGIIMTAWKQGIAKKEDVDKATELMISLNRIPAEIMMDFPVHACTDVTGFGLLGHLKEMVNGSGVSARINTGQVPVLNAALKYAAEGAVPGGSKNNLEFVGKIAHWSEGISDLSRLVLCDAQTSGGLLVVVQGDHADELRERLFQAGLIHASVIGDIIPGNGEIELLM